MTTECRADCARWRPRASLIALDDAVGQVELLDAVTGAPLPVALIEAALHAVIKGTPPTRADSPPSLAALTTADRDTWADARAKLLAHSAANVSSLGCIDDALFHLSLDEVGS
jgi:hypothetical protein